MLGNGAPHYGMWLAICALALAVAALGQRWPRIVPGSRAIGGIAILLIGGAILAIRFERLPREPIETDPGTSWQFGWALWVMTLGLILGVLALARAYLRRRSVVTSAVPKPVARWRALEAVLGSVFSATLIVAAGVGRAYEIAPADAANARVAHVHYLFDGWGHGVMKPGGLVGPVNPLNHFALFAAQDAVLVSLCCAVLLVAAVSGVSRRVGTTDLLRIGVGTMLIGAITVQFVVAHWKRGYFETGGKIDFTLGPSVWMLLGAAAVAWMPFAWRIWEHRTQQLGTQQLGTQQLGAQRSGPSVGTDAGPVGLDLLS